MYRTVRVYDYSLVPRQALWTLPTGIGLGLIGFGIAVIFVPALLVGLVAATCILLGIVAVGLGWRLRRFERAQPPAGVASPWSPWI